MPKATIDIRALPRHDYKPGMQTPIRQLAKKPTLLVKKPTLPLLEVAMLARIADRATTTSVGAVASASETVATKRKAPIDLTRVSDDAKSAPLAVITPSVVVPMAAPPADASKRQKLGFFQLLPCDAGTVRKFKQKSGGTITFKILPNMTT